MLYTLHQAIQRVTETAPERQAVRYGGSFLSYGELNARANQLARVLIDAGVDRGSRVGIYARKSLDSAVALFGIMKAGGAYVPLDPSAPPRRLATIIRDCGIQHVVSEPSRTDVLAGLTLYDAPLHTVVGASGSAPAPFRQVPWEETRNAADADPGVRLGGEDLAYVLYTSGSTGVPKGVTHTHSSALAFAEVAAETYGLRPGDRVSNHAPLHFDLSTLDYFATAVAGATTVIIPEAHTKLPASFAALIESERITVLYTVPLALTHLLLRGGIASRDLTSVRWVLFGGEPFPPKHLAALMEALPAARFSNVYGPTEVNGITYWVLPERPAPSSAVPIGVPYGEVELLVVDGSDQPVVPGEPGELLASTPSMMKGYWGRPDLDRKVFYSGVSADGLPVRYLRTGDLVRARADGALEFLGRKDRQVKIRGHRVELPEVELALSRHEDVETAAVYAAPDEFGTQTIGAAVILRSGSRCSERELHEHVAETLPPYAIPGTLEIVDDLPRTSTGKIDRRALATRAADTPQTSTP